MWYFYQLTCSVRLLWCGCNKMIQLVQVWLCVGGECQPCLRSVQSQQTKPWSTCWYTCVVQRSKFLWSNTQCLPSHGRSLLLLTAKSRNIFYLVVEQDCRMKQDRFPCQLVWNCLSQADCPTERYNFDRIHSHQTLTITYSISRHGCWRCRAFMPGKPAVGCWIVCMHILVVSMRCGG